MRDLFFATPARLKFLKEPRTESSHVADAMRRLAMAHPEIAFRLESEERTLLDLPAADPSLLTTRRGWSGSPPSWAATSPTMRSRSTPTARASASPASPACRPSTGRPAQHQYLFVNGRPVRDKLLAGAVRGAYQDFLARDRHPMVALFLEAPTELVDVNVHPAKTEVRFRDAGIVRGLIVGALRTALSAAGHRASTTVADAALGAFRPHTGYSTPLPYRSHGGGYAVVDPARPRRSGDAVHGAARRAVGRAPKRRSRPRTATARPIRWAWRARSCTRPTSWRRPTRAW